VLSHHQIPPPLCHSVTTDFSNDKNLPENGLIIFFLQKRANGLKESKHKKMKSTLT
jgi:hypothetical protein